MQHESGVYLQSETSSKRAYNLYTTDKAESIKNTLFGILDSWNEIMLDKLDRKERETLFNLIEKVGVNILNKANQLEQNTK